jgi:hypothetical protein
MLYYSEGMHAFAGVSENFALIRLGSIQLVRFVKLQQLSPMTCNFHLFAFSLYCLLTFSFIVFIIHVMYDIARERQTDLDSLTVFE